MRKVLLVGTGGMAREYARVLKKLDVPFDAVGRSIKGCTEFSKEVGIEVHPGGVESYAEGLEDYSDAIIAIHASGLHTAACYLMQGGIHNILLEKPGGLTEEELREVVQVKNTTKSNVYIGYNRRFYASVLKAENIICQDGGVKSFHFEFTEWPYTVLAAGLPTETLQKWLLCNSTHVIDLAFYLGGCPEELVSFVNANATWTKEHVCYAGAGITKKGALFDYCANWSSPGRWNIEIITGMRRLIFRPLERLQVQKMGSVKICDAEDVDYSLDTEYKPGLYREVSAFLGLSKLDAQRLKTADQQWKMFPIYEKIAGRRYT